MKVHQLARGLLWEQEPSLTLGCKRLRLLAPKLNSSTDHLVSFDFKSFIKPENGPRSKLGSSNHNISRDPSNSPLGPQVEMQNIPAVGGTRWNPTQEQIGILEMLYRGGMRTPNAQQIEQITAHLGKYGKIEGKNVFYWFQNHKARERQKQKHNTLASLAHSHSPPTPAPANCTPSPPITCITLNLETTRGEVVERDVQENSPYKKCRSWGFDYLEEDQSCKEEEEHRTLELFPLHPEGK